jgi:hypothetical protein
MSQLFRETMKITENGDLHYYKLNEQNEIIEDKVISTYIQPSFEYTENTALSDEYPSTKQEIISSAIVAASGNNPQKIHKNNPLWKHELYMHQAAATIEFDEIISDDIEIITRAIIDADNDWCKKHGYIVCNPEDNVDIDGKPGKLWQRWTKYAIAVLEN